MMSTGGCLLEDVYWRMSTGGCLLEDVYWRADSPGGTAVASIH